MRESKVKMTEERDRLQKRLCEKEEKLTALLDEHLQLMTQFQKLGDHVLDMEERLRACEKERDDMCTQNNLIKAEVSTHCIIM